MYNKLKKNFEYKFAQIFIDVILNIKYIRYAYLISMDLPCRLII